MITIVMGADYGSEGKGEFCAWFAREHNIKHIVRTGGPQAGHTVQHTADDGQSKMRQLPTAWVNDNEPTLYIARGSLISPPVLANEIGAVIEHSHRWGHFVPDIVIDERIPLVTATHAERERRSRMRATIGSTTEGIGEARVDHLRRRNGKTEFFDKNHLGPTHASITRMADVSEELNHLADRGEHILVESSQGYGLSINWGEYPYVTSRDITPGQILNDCGLSSRLEHRVVVVMRTHPIRVAGNSGPLRHETDWNDIMARVPHVESPERTTVTGNVRRIASQPDDQYIRDMVRVVRPDLACITFLDYAFPELYGVTDADHIADTVNSVGYFRNIANLPIGWVSTGPGIIVEV